RVLEYRVELLEGRLLAPRHHAYRRGIPVFHGPDSSPLPHQVVSRRHLVDPLIDRPGSRDRSEGEIVVQRLLTDHPLHARIPEQGFQLRAEGEPLPILEVVQRLLPDAVPGEQQASLADVPQGEGEHATQVGDAGVTPLLPPMNNDLGVRGGPEVVTALLELGPERVKVVDLSVEDDHLAAIFIEDRLITRGQIDDAETSMPKGRSVTPEEPIRIGTAVPQGGGQALDQGAINRVSRICVDHAVDPTHDSGSPLRGRWQAAIEVFVLATHSVDAEIL